MKATLCGWKTGFEPATPWTTIRCSTTELQPPCNASLTILRLQSYDKVLFCARVKLVFSEKIFVCLSSRVFNCLYFNCLVCAKYLLYAHAINFKQDAEISTTYLSKCLRALTEVNTSYLFSWIRALVVVVLSSKSPNGAILFHSPGRKPWVNRFQHPLSSFRSGTPPTGTQTTASPQRYKPNVRAESAAPEGAHIIFRFVYTQGFISGFALIPPWAMQEYRPKGLIYVFPITLLFWCGCY